MRGPPEEEVPGVDAPEGVEGGVTGDAIKASRVWGQASTLETSFASTTNKNPLHFK